MVLGIVGVANRHYLPKKLNGGHFQGYWEDGTVTDDLAGKIKN